MSETVITPDRATYIKAHILLGVVGGIAATIILWLLKQPGPWVGMVGAALAVGVRGPYLLSEEMARIWRLTPDMLEGPEMVHVPAHQRIRLPLSQIDRVRQIGSAVQVITIGGDKHLIKWLSDPKTVRARIEAAVGAAR